MKVIYPGSFDPLTKGHMDIIKRLRDMFDEVIVAILNNENKNALFSVDEREAILEEAIKDNLLEYIGEDVDKAYLEEVKGLTIRTELVKEHAKDLKVIYTPIHGSGNMPVRRVLKELGYENVEVVKEQEKPERMW